MRLALISDTHLLHDQITVPDGDVLIHAGDALRRGSRKEFREFISWFAGQPHARKLYVPGNHGACVEKYPDLCRQIAEGAGVDLLVDAGLTIDGWRFWGSPWTPRFGHWSFMRDRGSDIRGAWDQIPPDCGVLITHGPAYGHGDLAPGARNAGCIDLLGAIRLVKPRLHVCGHIHEGHGVTRSDVALGTVFVNAAICTGSYEPTQVPIVVDLAAGAGWLPARAMPK